MNLPPNAKLLSSTIGKIKELVVYAPSSKKEDLYLIVDLLDNMEKGVLCFIVCRPSDANLVDRGLTAHQTAQEKQFSCN